MKKVFVSGKEIKRRGWKVACVYGTSEKFIIPEHLSPCKGNYIEFGGQSRIITAVQAGRNGAYLLCPEVAQYSVSIRRSIDMFGKEKENAFVRTINGETIGHFSKEYRTAKAAAQSNKDCFGVRIGSTSASNFRWGIN